MHEIAARVIDGNGRRFVGDQRAVGRRVGIDAQQHETAGAGRRIVPTQMRVAVAAEPVRRAHREFGGDAVAVFETVAGDAHGELLG